MRKLLAALAAATVLTAVAPIASHALSGEPPARLQGALADRLASAPSGSRLLVFVHGRTTDDARRGIAAAGLTTVGELHSIGVPVAVGTPAQIQALTTRPGISSIEADRPLVPTLETSRKAIRADEAITKTYTHTTTTTTGKKHGKKATTTTVTTSYGPFDGTGQTIAIVDGGVDGTHPMFLDPKTGASKVVRNLKVACLNNIPGLTFEASLGTDPATCPSVYTGNGEDDEPFIVDMTSINDTDSIAAGGHGTHVAGIAGGVEVTTTDGHTFSGVAPGARIVGVTMGASLTIYGADAALDWVARHHADPCGDGSCPAITVVNNSYGNGGDWDPESATSKIQQKLIDAGVTMVWANGNGDATGDGGDGSDNRSGADAAAQIPGVIAVANYDDADSGTRDGTLDPSSSRGMRGSLPTYPDVSAPGTNITSACRPYLSICQGALSADPNYGTISGTSMAAPHVAGAVAVLQQAAVAKTGKPLAPAEVENLLEDTSYKFSFGAGYEPDPTNADDTTSFDKGHGLIDLTNAMETLLGAPLTTPAGGGGSTCAPGAPLVSDPAGDATSYALADTGTNEPNLDVTSVEVVGDSGAGVLRVGFHVSDLTDEGPASSTGMSFEGTVAIGDGSYDVGADRGPSGDTFHVGAVDVTGTFDTAGDTVWVDVPRAAIDDRFGTVTVGSLSAGFTRYTYSPVPVLGPAADSFAGACPQTVDIGGSEAPPDGVASAGSPFSWTSDPTTSVNAVGDPVPALTVEGETSTSQRVAVDVAPGGTVTFALTCPSPADDWDVTLTGPDGAPIGTGTGPGTSANGGCAEQIVVEDAPAGVYTATVTSWVAAHGTYTGTITVS